MSLDLNIYNETSYKFDHKSVQDILEKTVVEQGVVGLIEINLSVVSEETMADLHERFMKTREMTDVLSFPLWERREIEHGRGLDPDGVLRLGDIVICAKEAARLGEAINFLAGHGCLHLLGIHHEEVE